MFIDVADLSRAVAERTVDAQENPLTNLVNFNIHAHHRYVSLTGHLLGIALLLVNRARYDALPDASRRMLNAAARESEAHQRALATAEDGECLRLLADAGVDRHRPRGDRPSGLRAAMAPSSINRSLALPVIARAIPSVAHFAW